MACRHTALLCIEVYPPAKGHQPIDTCASSSTEHRFSRCAPGLKEIEQQQVHPRQCRCSGNSQQTSQPCCSLQRWTV